MQRVLSTAGRPDADIEENVPFPGRFVEARIRYGDDRSWQTDAALADAAQKHKTLSWRQAREVMQHASREWITSRIGRDRVQAVQAILTGGGQD